MQDDGERHDPFDPFDPGYVEGLVDEVRQPMIRHYFRPRLLGWQRIPRGGPAILASNHSGTAFPWDAMVLDCIVWDREGRPRRSKTRPVFEKELSAVWWMRPFGIDDFWRRGGGVDMTFDNFHHLLEGGHRVLYYPEGVPGIGKGFAKRYQLQRFSSSFVIHAARHNAPVVPIYTVNAEWVVPFNFTLGPLDRLVQRLARVPFMPLPAGPLAMIFPFLWYLSLPARMVFVAGEPIDVAAMVRETGVTDLGEPDRDTMRGVAERVRAMMQVELDRFVERYGRRPYQGRLLRRQLAEALKRRRLLRSTPLGWPLAFVRHERDRRREPARNYLTALLRDWDLIGFYLPLGWPFLAACRALRRPPYGYRGLDAKERRRREGAFVWHLSERPIPEPESEPPA